MFGTVVAGFVVELVLLLLLAWLLMLSLTLPPPPPPPLISFVSVAAVDIVPGENIWCLRM